MFPFKKSGTLIKRWPRNKYEKCFVRFHFTDLDQWKPAIGLEIHAQISSKSKLFSGAPTNFNSPVNSNVNLFDSAIPGTMPVLNKKCVEAGVLTALALSCDVNAVSMFERKHYFYSDLPAGFQITQQRKPLASNGEIKFVVFKPGVHKEPYSRSCKIKQIQLEQDSGKSFHSEDTGKSLIDLNRAGVPLMEIVFEPDLSNGEEAAALVKELCFVLQLLDTCSCKMEEGALRVDANVSVSKLGAPLGTRTELKNISSMHAVNCAIKYEIERQISILNKGGKISNQTRAWDSSDKKTIPMREKENNHDYRFMPEPNLPSLCLHVNEDSKNKYNLIDVPSLKKQLPESPQQIRKWLEQSGVTPQLFIAITSNFKLFLFYLDIIKSRKNCDPNVIAKIFISEVWPFLEENFLNVEFCINNQDYMKELMDLYERKVINQGTVRKLLNELLKNPNKMPKQIVKENMWFLISDDKELEAICIKVLEQSPQLVVQYKKGTKKIFKKFLESVIISTEGRADLAKASKILSRLLK